MFFLFLCNVCGVFFFGNVLGKGMLVVLEGEEGLRVLKRRCVRGLWGLLGGNVVKIYFGFLLFSGGVVVVVKKIIL